MLMTNDEFDLVLAIVTVPTEVLLPCRRVLVEGKSRVVARRGTQCDDGVLIRTLRRLKDTHLRIKFT